MLLSETDLTRTPRGMSRRHFMQHLAGASALAAPAICLTSSFQAQAADLKRRGKSAILLWMGGGPSTMDIWDLKPGANTGDPFKPIKSSAAIRSKSRPSFRSAGGASVPDSWA